MMTDKQVCDELKAVEKKLQEIISNSRFINMSDFTEMQVVNYVNTARKFLIYSVDEIRNVQD